MSEYKPKLKEFSKKWQVLALFAMQSKAAFTQLEIQEQIHDNPDTYGVIATVMTRIRELVAEKRLTRKVGKDGRARWKFRSW